MAGTYSCSKQVSRARDMQGVPVGAVSAQLGLPVLRPAVGSTHSGVPLLMPLPRQGGVMSSREEPAQPSLAWPLTSSVLPPETFP